MGYYQGTPPFVAIEAMVNYPEPFVHKPCHDLESILYVIFYFCTYFKGPGVLRGTDDFSQYLSVPLERWFLKDSLTGIGRNKIALIATFESSLLKKFAPYWADFVPFVFPNVLSPYVEDLPVTPQNHHRKPFL